MHAREVADVEASLARKRAQAEAEERQRMIDEEEAAEAERRRAAAHERAERCAQERADRLTAIARIESDAAKLKERSARRQIVEQWIAKNCRRLVQREYGTELVSPIAALRGEVTSWGDHVGALGAPTRCGDAVLGRRSRGQDQRGGRSLRVFRAAARAFCCSSASRSR